MEAMLCLGVPHAPACRPDQLLSHPSRRYPPLRRHHLPAFPHGGAPVASAARLRAVWPQPPAGKDATKGRAEGWHPRRGATCLKRGERAYCSSPNSNGGMPAASNHKQGGGGDPQSPAGGVEGFTLAPLVMNVMSSMFGGEPVAAQEPPVLLQVVVDRIGDEVRFLCQGFDKPILLRLLLQHLSDQMDIQEQFRWEANRRGLETTSSLYAEWWGLIESDQRKCDLGLLLTQIFINQGDYEKAMNICKHVIKDASERDARPRLLMAIIKTMLAMQMMLNPETTEADLLIIKNMRDEAVKEWENYYNCSQF